MLRYLLIASVIIGAQLLVVLNDDVRKRLHIIAMGHSPFVKRQADSPISSLQRSEVNHDAPLFVLHIGPPKTGTSSIQGYANQYEDLLKEDNIYFLGHNSKRNETRLHELSKFCRKCDTVHLCSQCPEKWKTFEEIVDQHFKLNHTAFVSDETFNRFFNDGEQYERDQLWNRLEPILSRWRVRVIFTYRRYSDWLPSTYHEFYNPNNKAQKDKWPDEGGAGVIPTFPVFLDRWILSNSENTRGKQPLTIKQKWQEHFPNVLVLNMHHGKGLLEEFYCRMLPEATRLCDHINSGAESLMKNPSSSKLVHYDMIAVAAYQKGWIGKQFARDDVAEAVRQKSLELGLLEERDFPLACPTEEQQRLFLNASLNLEVEVLSEPPANKDEVKEQFLEALDAGKFCSVDTESLLKNEIWQDFFEKLDPSSMQTKIATPSPALKNPDKVIASLEVKEIKSAAVGDGSASSMTSSSQRRPSSMLCLYTGDEGSTVLSEALRLHPQVYSPSWAVEPANARYWRKEPFTLKSQIEAIRFLLRLPSSITVYQHRRKPLSLEEYKEKVGNARATYIKVAVCKKLKHDEWKACMDEIVSNLLCGNKGEIVEHLILPVRYGFDRACSVFVHRDKQLYKANSQFSSNSTKGNDGATSELSEQDATVLRKAQELYVKNFITTVNLTRTTCPEQENRPQVHIFDYDHAKEIGIETALEQLLGDLGLRTKAGDLNLGRFSTRKPGDYCNTMFDKKSKRTMKGQETMYNVWLSGTCEMGGDLPWCKKK